MVEKKTILVTGANGFIAKNLCLNLTLDGKYNILRYQRNDCISSLEKYIKKADVIFHLAGVNRPKSEKDFQKNNVDFTENLCNLIIRHQKYRQIIFSSSYQADLANSYGTSKKKAEEILKKLSDASDTKIQIFRLPGIFGKWAKPNYNSVVATFCHNIANNIEIKIDDPSRKVTLVHIDDLVAEFKNILHYKDLKKFDFYEIKQKYEISLKDLAKKIIKFSENQRTLKIKNVGNEFDRVLYSTFVSYLPKERFSYPLMKHTDERGDFVEVLKTRNAGQFSYFTSMPGVTRGVHFHNVKTEKFVVLQGTARFRFRNILTNEKFEIITNEKKPTVVESIPGWSHDIKNIGQDILISIVWANEIFDRDLPDTYPEKTF